MTWRWSNPQPHGNNIAAMTYTNGVWIQATERGQVYSTTDLTTWAPWDTQTSNALRAVTYFKGKFIITGESGTILHGTSPSDVALIQLPTSDWLESVAASPSLLVAVGDNAAVYTSGDGVTWQRRTVPFSDWLRSVAYGAPGGQGKFVAVGELGTVATSNDGMQWQKLNSFTSVDLNRVVWASDRFLIAGDGGHVYSSLSGTDWTLVQSGATNDLFEVISQGGQHLVAGSSELRLSAGRTVWSNELDPAKTAPAPSWTYLSALWDGTAYLVGGRTGMLVEGFKTNSTSPTFWLPLKESVRNWLWEVKRFPNFYIAVGDRATIMTSIDGIDWSVELPPDSATNSILLGIGGRTNLAVAVGNAGTILVSPDTKRQVVSTDANGNTTTNEVSTMGVIWQAPATKPTSADLQGITASANLLVVSGGSGAILTSTDGTNWTSRNTPTSAFLSSVETFPGGFVASGASGTILTSPDGITWTTRSSGTTNWLFRTRYLGGKLITVGQNGTILTSSDAVSWKRQQSGTTRWLSDVQWLNNTFYIVGTGGTVLSSPDAVQWTDLGTITQKALYGAAHDNERLITVGVEGIILRTRVVPSTTPILMRFSHNTGTNSFVFVGERDQRFLLERSQNLTEWTSGPKFELLDSTGAALFSEPNANPPLYEFFRVRPVP